MSKDPDTPGLAKLSLDEDENVEDLFASPSIAANTTAPPTNNPTPSSSHKRPDSSAAASREAALTAELNRLRSINETITSVTSSLRQAQGNLETVQQTVGNAASLLGVWTRILSQTEHTQRLVLNPNWGGASKDLEEIEGEEARRAAEDERRREEEVRRREEVVRRAEEEERRKAAAVAAGAARGSGKVGGTRGRTRGVAGQVGRGRVTGTGTTASSRGGLGSGSGIARSGSTRGRGRGVS